jgi:uncharacterized protein YqfA (UPF0365 family)
MTVAEIETGSPVWDPAAAYRAHIVETSEREKSVEIQRSLARMAHTSMVDTVVRIPDQAGEKRRVNVVEYVAWLDERANAARIEIERFGGQAAVDAVYARIGSAISYAGEVEPQVQPNPEPSYPNYPA